MITRPVARSHRTRTSVVVAVAIAAVIGTASMFLSSGIATAGSSRPGSARGPIVQIGHAALQHLCAPASRTTVACDALVQLDDRGRIPASASAPNGLGADDIERAYHGDVSAGGGHTIAVVDVFDDANAESDLAVYRAQYGLAPCTSTTGCFTKINEHGAPSPLPTSGAGTGWPAEISLDLQMASAVCPLCHLVLVEASSAAWPDIESAVDTAAAHADVVSNSYGDNESASVAAAAQPHYDHPGVVMVASSGDGGFAAGPQLPAAFANVTSVGGTVLARDTSARGYTEQVWGGTRNGCSTLVAKPSYQHDAGCANRTIADVAAAATNIAVYDSLGASGWINLSGTSAAAPIVAGMYALAGDTASYTDPARIYQQSTALYDITAGSNGMCGTYLCNGATGYDGPTGLGTPNGAAAFLAPPAPVVASIGSASAYEGDAGARAIDFAVTLSRPATTPVTVSYAVARRAGDTATAGADFVAAAGTLLFTPQAGGLTSTVLYVTATIKGDTTVEPGETFTAAITSVSGATLGRSVARSTIVNDDPGRGLRLSVSNAGIVEGNAVATPGTGNGLRMHVSLSRPVPAGHAPIVVRYTVTGITATGGSGPGAGVDFVAVTTPIALTFTAGQIDKAVTVSVFADTFVEPDETLELTLVSATGGATISHAVGIGTIRNDD